MKNGTAKSGRSELQREIPNTLKVEQRKGALARMAPAGVGPSEEDLFREPILLCDHIRSLAPDQKPSCILVLGDSGVGKSTFARECLSPLLSGGNGPCHEVSVIEMPGTLFESTMFGYVRGAFTGAERSQDGLAKRVGTGTLFLDEIGKLGLPEQGKLLRFIQERKYRQVGGTAEITFDGHIVLAARENLLELVHAEKFLPDLLHRISQLTFTLPDLASRHRRLAEIGEVLWTADNLVNAGPAMEQIPFPWFLGTLLQCLRTYPWEGNYRELAGLLMGFRVRTAWVDDAQERQTRRRQAYDWVHKALADAIFAAPVYSTTPWMHSVGKDIHYEAPWSLKVRSTDLKEIQHVEHFRFGELAAAFAKREDWWFLRPIKDLLSAEGRKLMPAGWTCRPDEISARYWPALIDYFIFHNPGVSEPTRTEFLMQTSGRGKREVQNQWEALGLSRKG